MVFTIRPAEEIQYVEICVQYVLAAACCRHCKVRQASIERGRVGCPLKTMEEE